MDQDAEAAQPTGPGSGAAGASRALIRAGLLVSSLYLASRLLGWLRVSVLAATFGTGHELDAFYAAFRIPDLMFQLVAAGALSSALIPMIAGFLATGERERAWRVTATVTNLMLLALLALAIVFEITAPILIPLITPGYSAADLALTVDLTRLMLVSPILLALGTAATSALNATGRFGAAALAPVVYNLGIIGGALLLAAPFGVQGLAIGVVVGSVGHFLVQLRPLQEVGFRYRPAIDLADPRARETLILLGPRAFGLGVTQVVYVVVTSVASTLGTGSVTMLNFAFTLLVIPIGVLGVPLGAVAFPSLARDHATGSTADFVALVMRACRLVVFVMVPLSAVAILLRREIVTILFDYGRYDPRATDTIATTFAVFMLGLVAHAALPVLARAFYARHDTRTPVAAAVLTVVINSSLAVLLAGSSGLPGIAASFTIAAWIEAFVLFVALRRQLPSLDLGALGRLLAVSTLATVVAFVIANLGLTGWLGTAPSAGTVASIERALVGTAVFGAVFLGAAAALRISELPALAGILGGVIRRPRA